MSLALYRTYRPGRFADVVGQEHVTATLSRALRSGRLHHAYLFSGPRGCGKTSSARILARSLNCAEGPTPEPCGRCQACVDLAPNGPGSVDVIEIDAATHGLVDDARELRERAHFSPAASRFKVYIIDEAHQLGPGAANALLKIIEEPPPHVMFVFATTAPDKLLPTIRSRTHHYPFRLVPARTLVTHMADICAREEVDVQQAALTLVARASGGSVRDALSILGQLIAGADASGVTSQLANSLLGFTDTALLDDVVEALSVRDATTVFAAVDRVTETGHDPRRFLTDLLERLRDLLLLQQVPDAAERGLVEGAEAELAAMLEQSRRFGPTELLRLGTIVDDGITAMKGATPTRLQLELVCARMLLPSADDSTLGVQARIEVLERRLATGGPPGRAEPATGRPQARVGAGGGSEGPIEPAATRLPAGDRGARRPAGDVQFAEPTAGMPPAEPIGHARSAEPTRDAGSAESAGMRPPQAAGPPSRVETPPAAAAGLQSELASVPAGPSEVGELSVADVRRMWPEVLDRLRDLRKAPWSFISRSTSVLSLDGTVLTLACASAGLRDQLNQREDYSTYLRQALHDVLAVDWQVVAVVDPSTTVAAPDRRASSRQSEQPWLPPDPSAGSEAPSLRPSATERVVSRGGAGRGRRSSAAAEGSTATEGTTATEGSTAPEGSAGALRPGGAHDLPPAGPERDPELPDGRVVRDLRAGRAKPDVHDGRDTQDGFDVVDRRDVLDRRDVQAARGIAGQSPGEAEPGAWRRPPDDAFGDDEIDPDDPDLAFESHRELLARELGATVIGEIPHD